MRLRDRKIKRFVNLITEVVRAISNKSDLDSVDKFYHEFSYHEFQHKIRKSMCVLIEEEIDAKAISGLDFNDFILKH